MKELGDALKAIFDKVGGFLDLFDLSFFISGATAVAAVALACFEYQVRLGFILPDWITVTLIIVATYVAGMVCFALGRWMRQRLTKTARPEYRGEVLQALMKLHGLHEQEPIKGYLERATAAVKLPMHDPAWALYTRIWAGIRHDPALHPSLTVLNRYWIMSASYDGLAVALLLWGGILARIILPENIATGDTWTWTRASLTFLGGIGCACLCAREAGRYTMHQLGEIAATLAAAQKPK
jgi:hypothetical protein